MCHRGYFRKNYLINVYYIKLWNNNIKHFINECEELKKIRNKLKELDIKSENNYI